MRLTSYTWCCWGTSYDYLYLYNSAGSQLTSYTGVFGAVSYSYTIWDSPYIRIRFQSDSSNYEEGFRLNYTLSMSKFLDIILI